MLLGLCTKARSQEYGFKFFPTDVAVRVNNQTLLNAWAGGFNSAQFWKIDLNADGTEDLVIFDRTNQKVSTFLTQNKAYVYTPKYEQLFPSDIQNWLQLIDFDNDGKKDLFTFTPQGIRLFKNTATSGVPTWKLVADPLYSVGFSGKINLYVASTDIPAITDVDNDGDLDVLTFDFSGNFVEFHKNFTIEEKKAPSELIYRKQGFCWGNFYKEFCKDFRFDIDCQTGQLIPQSDPNARIAHTGNSMLVEDVTGDGKKDVLFGYVGCTNLAMLPNVGTVQDALFKAALYDYPVNNPINFQIFPAVFFDDFDNDGKKELLASPNLYSNDSNYLTDFAQSAWLYRNGGTNTAPSYIPVQKDFLQNTMLDVGENAAPAFADLDGDGDQDILVGISGKQTTDRGYRGSLWVLKNSGTKTAPSFELQNTDYLGISSAEQLFDLVPFFTDFDGNGVADLGIISNSQRGIEARFVPNQARKGEAMQLDWKNVRQLALPSDTRNGDSVLFYDLDSDGDLDLLIGKSYGNLDYYRNDGTTTAPQFQLETDSFGGFNGDDFVRNIAVNIADLNGDLQPELVLTDGDGFLSVYSGLSDANPKLTASKSVLWDELSNQYARLRLGGRLVVSFADLNGDRLPDMVVGTNSGGLRILLNTSVSKTPPQGIENILVYPNPTSRLLYVIAPTDSELEIYSAIGQKVTQRAVDANQRTAFDASLWADGMYLIRATSTNGNTQTVKVWVRR